MFRAQFDLFFPGFRSLHSKPIPCARVCSATIVDSHTFAKTHHRLLSDAPRSIFRSTMNGSPWRSKYGSMQSMSRFALIVFVELQPVPLFFCHFASEERKKVNASICMVSIYFFLHFVTHAALPLGSRSFTHIAARRVARRSRVAHLLYRSVARSMRAVAEPSAA